MSNPITAAGTGFTGGGVSPQQSQLAQFTRGEREIGAEGRFSGIPDSTNLTQAGTVGPDVGEALNLSETSSQLAAALGQFANAQQLSSKSIAEQQVGTIRNALGKITGG